MLVLSWHVLLVFLFSAVLVFYSFVSERKQRASALSCRVFPGSCQFASGLCYPWKVVWLKTIITQTLFITPILYHYKATLKDEVVPPVLSLMAWVKFTRELTCHLLRIVFWLLIRTVIEGSIICKWLSIHLSLTTCCICCVSSIWL